VPLDPVKDATLRMVAGSHKWPKPVLPTKWLSNENFYPTTDEYLPVPDPEKEHMDIKEFKMEPGDAVAFNFNILHGARGVTADQRRRAFSLRLLGDDTSYTERPGPTSPPFPQHNMEENQVLRTDWFPFIEF
jgi:ectoine hydroxylase-related dioxygenase (phytanoyl-CoA dioxygenase family)